MEFSIMSHKQSVKLGILGSTKERILKAHPPSIQNMFMPTCNCIVILVAIIAHTERIININQPIINRL